MSEPTIAFGQPIHGWEQAEDAAFLQAVAWRRQADRDLAHSAGPGDVREFAHGLRRSLRTAARRMEQTGCGRVAARRRSGTNGRLSPDSLDELRHSLEALCRDSTDAGAAQLFAAWRSALIAAIELSLANGWPPAGAASEPVAAESPALAALVRHAELPWAAGLIFRDVSGAAPLRKAARRRFQSELLDRTDAEGVPHAELFQILPEWFASLVRAAEWGEAFGKPLWNGETGARFEQLTRRIAALCDRRGWSSAAERAGGEHDHARLSEWLLSAARLTGWKKRRPAARLIHALSNGAADRPPDLTRGPRPQRDAGGLPSVQSDASGLACLRTDWSIDADVLVLAHHAPQVELRLSIFGTPLFSGPWTLDVTVDGRPVELAESWNCVCWASDGDGDYLELQQRLDNGLRIERQVLLAREDRLLVLADAVSGAGEGLIEYTARLRLAAGATAAADRATRECGLRAGRLTARAFPLALADDRVLSTPGALLASQAGLELRQTSRGGLYAPLVLDWHPRRKRGYADWRTLTVGEDGRRVSPAEAWGHRLRIADFQVLVYRSLTEARPFRTVLGQHTTNETLVGRFDSDGEVEPYVLVE